MIGLANHKVAVLALDGVLPIDLGIPVQIFAPCPFTPYETVVCGVLSTVKTSAGFSLHLTATLEALAVADTIVVPGYSPHDRVLPDQVLEAIAEAHARGARLISICIGAFALAAAGVLDGRRVTTHWGYAAELAGTYPALSVDPDVLYVDDGDILTSAGVSAGIDLCLHVVREDLGATVANTLARRLVAAPHRDGGQQQFIETPIMNDDTASLSTIRTWALEHLAEPLTVTQLANLSGLTERTLTRRFHAETGSAPMRWLMGVRINHARALLEQTDASIDQIAEQTGLGTAANLRIHFRRKVGTTPTGYRTTFRHNTNRAEPDNRLTTDETLATPATGNGSDR